MRSTASTALRTFACTVVALVAFAANSILCRQALGAKAIDAASFSTIRLGSGALALFAIVALSSPTSEDGRRRLAGNWRSAGLLFAYAVPFSFAYVSLAAGTGALLLFGAVQSTMILGAIRAGERLGAFEWLGLVLALGGLAYLVSPGLAAPSPVGSMLMIGAGIAWGLYSMRGRGEDRPLAATAGNFVRSVPLVLAVSLAAIGAAHVTLEGALLASASGVLASGVGYAVWYAALRGLTARRAALVQLTVPIIAAAGGILFLSEALTSRLVIAAVLVLGGVALSLSVRTKKPDPARRG